jgi:amino-acid N-acetyltransferase
VSDQYEVRAARRNDAQAISDIIALNRNDPGLYQKPAGAVARSIADFVVVCDSTGRLVGCAALHVESSELAEIYAVAVSPDCQGQGVGKRLMNACLERAESHGLHFLWLATIKPEYFSRYNFQPISRWELPAAVLLRKFGQTFEQPLGRWLPALFGRHTFMKRQLPAILR